MVYKIYNLIVYTLKASLVFFDILFQLLML